MAKQIIFMEETVEIKTVYLIKSGVGDMKAYATCKIGTPFEVTDYNTYNQLRLQHCVPLFNKFDWNGNTKVFYPLLEVTPLEEEIPIKSHSPIIGIIERR